MSDRIEDTEDSSDGGRPRDPVESVEAYRDDDRVVLYDARNPLGWMESDAAVSLAERT
jgi:hypothetical protein